MRVELGILSILEKAVLTGEVVQSSRVGGSFFLDEKPADPAGSNLAFLARCRKIGA